MALIVAAFVLPGLPVATASEPGSDDIGTMSGTEVAKKWEHGYQIEGFYGGDGGPCSSDTTATSGGYLYAKAYAFPGTTCKAWARANADSSYTVDRSDVDHWVEVKIYDLFRWDTSPDNPGRVTADLSVSVSDENGRALDPLVYSLLDCSRCDGQETGSLVYRKALPVEDGYSYRPTLIISAEALTCDGAIFTFLCAGQSGIVEVNHVNHFQIVREIPTDSLTSTSITSAPATVEPGGTVDVCWNVQGRGDISGTRIRGGASLDDMQAVTPTQSGSIPSTFCDSFDLPPDAPRFYIRSEAWNHEIGQVVRSLIQSMQVDDPDGSGALLVKYGMNAADHNQPVAGKTRDSSGNSQHASLNNAPSQTSGKNGNGYLLDSAAESIQVRDTVTDNLSSGTMTVWVNLDSLAWTNPVFSKRDSEYGDPELSLYIDSSGYVNFRTSQAAGSSTLQSSTVIGTEDFWHHLAVTWGPDGKRIYLNGDLSALDSDTTGVGPGGHGVISLIGMNPSHGSNSELMASLDDFRIYDGALGGSQIRDIRNNPA